MQGFRNVREWFFPFFLTFLSPARACIFSGDTAENFSKGGLVFLSLRREVEMRRERKRGKDGCVVCKC